MRPQYEVADVIRQFFPPLLAMNPKKMTVHHRKTLEALRRCRTAELGGHLEQCNDCSCFKVSYNSCRNRNCPKCQGVNKESWIVQQEDMLLEKTHHHVPPKTE